MIAYRLVDRTLRAVWVTGLSGALVTACSGDSFNAVPGGGTAGSSAGTAGTSAGTAGTGTVAGAGGDAGSGGDSGFAGVAGAAAGVGGVAGESGAAGAAGAAAGVGGIAGSSDAGGGGVAGTSGGQGGGVAGAAGTAGGGAGAAGGGAGASGASGAAGSAGGGAAGAAGTAGGGAAGAAGAGGDAGAGQGGTAGAGGCTATSQCGGGATYCDQAASECRKCSNLDHFAVGAPALLSLDVVASSYKGIYYPRVEFYEGKFVLFYRGDAGADGDLRLFSSGNDAFTGGSGYLLAPPISLESAYESGPTPLPADVTGARFHAGNVGLNVAGTPYLLFDSNRSKNTKEKPTRRLFVGRLPSASANTPVVEEVDGVNTGPVEDGDDYSPTFASETGRLYWMRRRPGSTDGSPPVLMTKLFPEAPMPTPDQPTEVMLDPAPCVAGFTPASEDMSPWVTPDGSWLFYHDRCVKMGAPETATSRAFRIPLDPSTGQVVPGAQAELIVVPSNNGQTAKSQRSPSLSPDRCTLYLEIDNTIYYARRR
jgi:hypothetical protein